MDRPTLLSDPTSEGHISAASTPLEARNGAWKWKLHLGMALEIAIAFEKNLDVRENLNFSLMEIEIVLEKKRSFFLFRPLSR